MSVFESLALGLVLATIAGFCVSIATLAALNLLARLRWSSVAGVPRRATDSLRGRWPSSQDSPVAVPATLLAGGELLGRPSPSSPRTRPRPNATILTTR